MYIGTSEFSEREKEVTGLLLQGKSNKQIALALGISASTVEYHLKNVYKKLQVNSRTEAVIRLGKSVGDNVTSELGKSTVEMNDETADNGVQPISTRRIPMNKMYMLIGGGLLMTALVVVFVLANMPAQNTEVIPTVQASATSVIQLPTETSLPPTSTLTLEPVLTTMTAAAVPSIMDVAHFVGENYPDGTNVATGATFTKTWKLQNAGTTTWTTGYSLIMTEASYPLGESQGHPPVINLPREVKPGETVEISANITAPKTDTLYEVHYKLKNADGQFVSGDGNEIWFKVTVGNVSAVTNSVKPSNVTIQLVNLQKEAATTTAEICAQLPDTRGWILDYAVLYAGSVQAEFTSFRLKNSKDPNTYTNSYRCFFFEFPVGSNDYGNEPVKISINEVHIPSDASNCPSVKPQLVAQYPGLDFTCGSIGFFYTNLKVPSGMTESEADKIIMDAMEYAIYGPWVLSG
jgi:DNA-binding CsgD family transcriptional regulator